MTRRLLVPILAGLLLSMPNTARAETGGWLDPFNRAMFAFNQGVVSWVVEPTAKAAGRWVPAPVRTGLSNAYANLTEVEQILNGILRGDGTAAGASAGRFLVNGTAGIGGLFDVATPLGLKRVESDFGASLCKAGLPPGPFVVLPLVGPTNVNAAVALTGGVALEVYALSFISTTLAAVDFIVIDLGGSAAALRHIDETPMGGPDAYTVQREEYRQYIEGGCGGHTVVAPVPSPPEIGKGSATS